LHRSRGISQSSSIAEAKAEAEAKQKKSLRRMEGHEGDEQLQGIPLNEDRGMSLETDRNSFEEELRIRTHQDSHVFV
jgi:hypothetical protein